MKAKKSNQFAVLFSALTLLVGRQEGIRLVQN